MITERHTISNVACRLIMKAISKDSLAGCLVHLDVSNTTCLVQQYLQIPEHANNRTTYQAGFLMLVNLLEIDSPLVALMPFWSLPDILKITNRLSLLICTKCHTQDNTADIHRF